MVITKDYPGHLYCYDPIEGTKGKGNKKELLKQKTAPEGLHNGSPCNTDQTTITLVLSAESD
jgi:hypothetical protein